MKLSALSPALLGLVASVLAGPSSSIEYSTVTGYFLQDETATDPSAFDYVSDRATRLYLKLNLNDLAVPLTLVYRLLSTLASSTAPIPPTRC